MLPLRTIGGEMFALFFLTLSEGASLICAVYLDRGQILNSIQVRHMARQKIQLKAHHPRNDSLVLLPSLLISLAQNQGTGFQELQRR